jgi:hypothetical protein
MATINDAGMVTKQFNLSNTDLAILNHFFDIGQDYRAVVESKSEWYC